MSLGIRVRVSEAEKAKKQLKEMRILDTARAVKKDGGHVFFPVLKPIDGFEVVDTDFEVLEKVDFEGLLSEFLTPEEIEKVRFSFDIVGDIAVIEIPGELERWDSRIGEALIKVHRHIKSVYKKSSEIRGEERIRELEHVAGEARTVTLHREHGCGFKVDISKAYFSPRLSYERQRIMELTKDGEVVVDMFAGVGPFAVLLAKYRDVKVYAIDINPRAIELLKENIALNKVHDKVIPMLGDCSELAPRKIADRVIMNLPMKASEYLGVAMEVIKKGTIHFYGISPEKDLFDSWAKFIRKVGEEKNRKVEITATRIVRPYAPRVHHVVLDIGVSA